MVSNSASQRPGELTERHRQVLDTAMALIAERGLKAASLRELARRLDMSQPSLYHYFASKDELVGQIIANYSARTMASAMAPAQVDDLQSLLRLSLQFIHDMYATEAHVVWMRFLFAVTMERPEFGGLLRASFIDRGLELAERLAGRCVELGDVRAEDVRPALELAAGALSMRLLERRVMRTASAVERVEDGSDFIDFVVQTVAGGVKRRAQER